MRGQSVQLANGIDDCRAGTELVINQDHRAVAVEPVRIGRYQGMRGGMRMPLLETRHGLDPRGGLPGGMKVIGA